MTPYIPTIFSNPKIIDYISFASEVNTSGYFYTCFFDKKEQNPILWTTNEYIPFKKHPTILMGCYFNEMLVGC